MEIWKSLQYNFFCAQDCVGCLVSFMIPINFDKLFPLTFVKNYDSTLIEIVLNL